MEIPKNNRSLIIYLLVLLCIIILSCLLQVVFLHQSQQKQYSNESGMLALSLAHFTKKYNGKDALFNPQTLPIPNVITPRQPIISKECENIINTLQFHQFCINYTTNMGQRMTPSNLVDANTQKPPKCQQHERIPYEVEKHIIWNNTVVDIPNCKTLWIVAMSEGDRSSCQNTGDGEGDGYKTAYAAALQSARQHAGETLQPVLFIGRGDLDPSIIANRDTPIPLSAFGQWAEQQGVIVRQILQDHGLLHNPGICDRHVFYTDADVLFVYDFTREDLHAVKHRMMLSNKILSHGRDFVIWRKRPVNTGVIGMDVQGFAKEWPKILDFASRRKVFPDLDQTLLYEYYADRRFHLSQVDVLPLCMHWKVYWRLDPSTMHDIKIVHFHGAKPGSGVEEMAQCVTHDILSYNTHIPSTYRVFLQEAVCCDHGRTAATVLQLYHSWRPVGISAICNSQ